MFLSRRGLGARSAWFCAIGLMLASAGCEPASISDARTQLGRGPQRTVTFAVTVVDETDSVGNFIDSTVTTPQGLLGIKVDSQTVHVAVGDKLRFNGVSSDTLRYNAGPVLGVPGTYNVDTTYTLLSVEPRLQAIDTIVADSGSLSVTMRNRLPVQVPFSVTLNGVRGAGGAPLTGNGVLPAAPGDGSYTTQTLTFNLAGVTITPSTASAHLTFSFTVPSGGISPASLGDSSLVQRGSGTIVVRSLEGTLDPAKTPELTVAVKDSQQVNSSQFNFGDLQEALDSTTLNDVAARLTLNNNSGARLVLSNFVLTTDSAGTAISVPVTDPGLTTLTLAPGATKVDTLQVARLANWVVHEALKGGSPAIVASGTTTAGDAATVSRIDNTAQVSVGLGMTVGLDFTLPASGITFGRYGVEPGAGLAQWNADQTSQHVDTASAAAIVTNNMPFGVEVRLALVPDSVPNMPIDSAFTLAGRVELGPVSLNPAAVDAQGRVTTAVEDTASVGLSGEDAKVLLGDRFTAFIRVRLLPNASGNRGALRPADNLRIRASGSVTLTSGGTP
jgi:hypothetical protein